jgi:adenylylsulfate reductase subunit A
MPKTIVEDNIDILVAGAGLGGTGAAFEARYWGKDKKIVIAEKANIDRSGAVAQGLYAINCYMGTRFGENNPEDHVRYARIDLMGMVREDLLFDMARHVDSTVHQFEEWGLPIMRDPKTGAYQREGRWQIMIHGESYKPIVAEAAKKSADKVFNRICVTHLLMDDAKENRVAGATTTYSSPRPLSSAPVAHPTSSGRVRWAKARGVSGMHPGHRVPPMA